MLTTVRPRVALDLAAAHLRALGVPGPPRVDIAWAGPVALPFTGETDVQAACGLAAVHGRRYGRPEPLHVPYASVLAGVLAAQGALAVLVDRARGGPDRRATTSVAQAALLAVAQYLAAATTDADADPVPGALPDGPPFVSADGIRFEIETLYAEAWAAFWTALGAPPDALRRGWPPFQARFGTATCVLPADLPDATRRRPYAAVVAAGAAAGVSVVEVRAEPVPAGPPWRFTPLGRTGAGGPPPGDAPLRRFTVVEATRRVQGPLAGHLLRMLGADVVRVEPPGGDPMRGVPPMAGAVSARFLALNRDKRVVEADLGTPAGRAALRELVAGADVFLHNWAPGRAARWSLDAADLAAVRPGLVHAYASGWGDTFGTAPPVGTDYVVQAASGLAARLGPAGVPATPSLVTLTDVLGALVCVEGVLAALLHRVRTGEGQCVDTSLRSAAGVLTAAPRHVPATPTVPVCADVAGLARDPRFAAALAYDGCALVRAPWRFEPA